MDETQVRIFLRVEICILLPDVLVGSCQKVEVTTLATDGNDGPIAILFCFKSQV